MFEENEPSRIFLDPETAAADQVAAMAAQALAGERLAAARLAEAQADVDGFATAGHRVPPMTRQALTVARVRHRAATSERKRWNAALTSRGDHLNG